MADIFDEATDIVQSSVEQVDVDPAADFLTQQQNDLADLENDTLETFPDSETQQPSTEAMDDFFLVNNDSTNNNFEDITDAFDDKKDEDFEQMDPSQAYAAIAAADARLEELRSEPEKIRLWREEQTKYLNEKDSESDRMQQEWISQARKDLEDWDRNRLEQLEKTKEGNRVAEKRFIQERDNPTSGTEWEQVSKLCEFNPKDSKGTKDLTRMRSTLLHLKQNPRPVTVSVK